MTEDNQNNEFKPQPLPGQVFIRPGIDDRPDYEKTLTPEAKAAMRRLSVQQHPRIPEASNERPETQAARIASEGGAPLTAAAHLDVAVPNLESSFLDLRDPMTAPDGTKPTAMQANRLVAGFALGSMLLSAPMAAFNTVLIPQTVSRLSGINRVTDLAMLVIAGAIMTFLLNACIAVGSDHSYCRFGRRTPWIVSGSVLAAICMAILSACDFLPWAVFFWLATQAAYAMAAIPFAAAFGERVPDKFRDRADSWHGKGLALGQLVGVAVAVALTPHAGGEGWDGTTGFAMLVFGLSSRPSLRCWYCRSKGPAATCRVGMLRKAISSRNTVRRRTRRSFLWHSRPACSPLRPQPESPYISGIWRRISSAIPMRPVCSALPVPDRWLWSWPSARLSVL